MHVDVHLGRVDGQADQPDRKAPPLQQRRESLHQGLGQRVRADDPTVHQEDLGCPRAARLGRKGDQTVHQQALPLPLDGDQPVGRDLPQAREPLRGGQAGRKAEELLAVGGQAEMNLRPGGRQSADQIGDLRGLGGGAAQELAAGRSVVEQVPNRDARPGDSGHRSHPQGLGTLDAQFGPVLGVGFAGLDLDAGHGGDAGQGLPPKAQGDQLVQVLPLTDLGGREALDRQPHIGLGHAVSVIGHPDQRRAPPLKLDGDPRGGSVQRVLDQFLDDRDRTLDHLPGGDPLGHALFQDLNPRHVASWRGGPRRARPFRAWSNGSCRRGVLSAGSPPARRPDRQPEEVPDGPRASGRAGSPESPRSGSPGADPGPAPPSPGWSDGPEDTPRPAGLDEGPFPGCCRHRYRPAGGWR